MRAMRVVQGIKIQVRTNRWGSSPVSESVMYQLGLKPLPQIPPRTTVRVRRNGEKIGAPACKPQTSFFQLSRSFSLIAVPKVSRRSSEPKQ